MPGLHTNRGAKRAREARAELGLPADAPVGCILGAIEDACAVPVVIAALPEGIEGWCARPGGRPVIFANGLQAAARLRFTLAHELGHLRCGHDAGVLVDTSETLAGRNATANEEEANAFAAELLAPAEGVRAMVAPEPTLEDVVRIAARFGVSPVAALYRLGTLRLSRRIAVLERELDAGLHHLLADRLALPGLDDAVARLERRDLPRLSPALRGGALGALADGTASLAEVAAAAGCSPGRLAAMAAAMGI